jgi:predicted transcriptional regulator
VRKFKRGPSNHTALRILRVAAGLTQQDLARRLNTDQSTVSRIEAGQVWLTPMLERQFIEACGGVHNIQMVIHTLQCLRDRYKHQRSMPA